MGERLNAISIFGMALTMMVIAIVILSKNPEEKKIKLTHSIKGLVYAFLGSLGQAVGLIFRWVHTIHLQLLRYVL